MTKRRRRDDSRSALSLVKVIATGSNHPLLFQDVEMKGRGGVPLSASSSSSDILRNKGGEVMRMLCFAGIPACVLSAKGSASNSVAADESAAHSFMTTLATFFPGYMIRALWHIPNDDPSQPEVQAVIQPLFRAIERAIALNIESVQRVGQFELTPVAKEIGKIVKSYIRLNMNMKAEPSSDGAIPTSSSSNRFEPLKIPTPPAQDVQVDDDDCIIIEEGTPSNGVDSMRVQIFEEDSESSDDDDGVLVVGEKKNVYFSPEYNRAPMQQFHLKIRADDASHRQYMENATDQMRRHHMYNQMNSGVTFGYCPPASRSEGIVDFGQSKKSKRGPPEVWSKQRDVKKTQFVGESSSDSDSDAGPPPASRMKMSSKDGDCSLQLNLTSSSSVPRNSDDSDSVEHGRGSSDSREDDVDDYEEVDEDEEEEEELDLIDEWNENDEEGNDIIENENRKEEDDEKEVEAVSGDNMPVTDDYREADEYLDSENENENENEGDDNKSIIDSDEKVVEEEQEGNEEAENAQKVTKRYSLSGRNEHKDSFRGDMGSSIEMIFNGENSLEEMAQKNGWPADYEKRLIGVVANEELCYAVENIVYQVVEKAASSVEKLSKDAWLHYERNTQNMDIFHQKMAVRGKLLAEFQKLFPDKHLHMYVTGSSVNGCGSFNSDMDMCICYPTTKTKGVVFDDFHCDRVTSLRVLRRINKQMRKGHPSCEMKRLVYGSNVINATVPIITVQMRPPYEDLDIDINVNNIAGIYNSHLIHYYSQIDGRFPALALLVKHWTRRKEINDAQKGTMNSYSVILLVLHFLQCGVRPAVLPNLQYIYPEKFDTRLPIEELQLFGELSKKLPARPPNTWSLGELTIGFFNYYANFNFMKNAISIRSGQVFNRKHLPSQTSFFQMFIEEPFDAVNTARCVRKDSDMSAIKWEFRKAAEILNQNSFDLKDIGVIVNC